MLWVLVKMLKNSYKEGENVYKGDFEMIIIYFRMKKKESLVYFFKVERYIFFFRKSK